MALVTNSVTSYDVDTNREDLADAIYMIEPADTPFLSSVPRATATNVLHEWSTDDLDSVNTSNAQLEGAELSRAASTNPTRRHVMRLTECASLYSRGLCYKVGWREPVNLCQGRSAQRGSPSNDVRGAKGHNLVKRRAAERWSARCKIVPS